MNNILSINVPYLFNSILVDNWLSNFCQSVNPCDEYLYISYSALFSNQFLGIILRRRTSLSNDLYITKVFKACHHTLLRKVSLPYILTNNVWKWLVSFSLFSTDIITLKIRCLVYQVKALYPIVMLTWISLIINEVEYLF